jgi:hypothetical protein
MKPSLIGAIVVSIVPVLTIAPAQAFQFFTGYDANPIPDTALPLADRINSTAAFNSYKANLGGVGAATQGFEGFAANTDLNVAIGGSTVNFSGVTGTFSNTVKSTGTATSLIVRKADLAGLTNSGTYPTEGKNGISISSANNVAIRFSSPLQAFSFWGTDLGDSKNTLTIELYKGASPVGTRLIDFLGADAGQSSTFFYGVVGGSTELFDEVRLISSISSNGDAIGLDQFTVGTPGQVVPTAVPTPALLPGLIATGLGIWRRRQNEV